MRWYSLFSAADQVRLAGGETSNNTSPLERGLFDVVEEGLRRPGATSVPAPPKYKKRKNRKRRKWRRDPQPPGAGGVMHVDNATPESATWSDPGTGRGV